MKFVQTEICPVYTVNENHTERNSFMWKENISIEFGYNFLFYVFVNSM